MSLKTTENESEALFRAKRDIGKEEDAIRLEAHYSNGEWLFYSPDVEILPAGQRWLNKVFKKRDPLNIGFPIFGR